MENMKLKLLLLLSAVSLLTGCVNLGAPGTKTDTIEDVKFWSSTAATFGAQYALMQNPGYRPQFEIVVAQLDQMVASGNFNATTFHGVLSTLPIKELKSPEALLAITTATVIYQRYGKSVALDDTSYVGAAVVGVRDGLKLALSTR